eukprot:4000050-Pyramimonas_sp.AAC.1
MLEPPPDGGYGQEEDPHRAAATFRCMMQLVIFHDNLESALDRGRPWIKLMSEFRARLNLLVDVSQAALCENDTDYLGVLRTWSSFWVREQRIAVADVSLGARRSEAMKALTVLRSSSIEVAATRAFKNVLDFRKGLDDGIIQLATQLKDTFPKACSTLLDEAKTRDNIAAVLGRLSKDEPVSLIEIAGAAADGHELLQQDADTTLMAEVMAAYGNAVDSFIASSKGVFEFDRLHGFFEVVIAARETGDFSSCPWMEKTNDQGIIEDMGLYDQLYKTANSTFRIAEATLKLMLKFDGCAKRVSDVQAVRDENSKVSKMEGDVKMIIATASIGNTLFQRPRPKTYTSDVKKTKAYYVKTGVQISKLGKFLRDVLKEAEMVDSIAVEADAVSVSSKDTAAAAPTDIDGKSDHAQPSSNKRPRVSS